MFKKIFGFFSICAIFVLTMVVDVSAAESNVVIEIANQLSDLENYSLKTEEYEIYGNDLSINEDEFYCIATNIPNKIYVHYSTKNYYQEYDLKVVVNNQGYLNCLNYSLSNENDIPSINKMKNFMRLYEEELLSYEYLTYSTSDYEGIFEDSVTSDIFIIDFVPYGYITAKVYLKEYSVSDLSSLFIATVSSTFVPGVVANDNDLEGYKNWKNRSGYVHMTVEQAYDATEEYYYGRRYGAIPYYKDYWPVNVPGTVTISSSFGAGGVIGYSQKDGFKVEGNVSYGYSKSFTVTDPVVNAQFDNTLSKAMWSYEYEDNTAKSYDQETNILYEISKSGNGLFYGDVRLKLDYKFEVKKFLSGKTLNDSLDLVVRPTQNRIYGFCYGML